LRVPDSFTIRRDQAVERIADGPWRAGATSEHEGAFATFEFREQIVGWPYFTIDAPAGTIVELMPQEAHDARTTAWLDTEFFSWSRFICREGTNRFETFDYESLRWLQLHMRNASARSSSATSASGGASSTGPTNRASEDSEAPLQRLFDASINTLRNCASKRVVDGMARERQQYSGDGGHQLHAVRWPSASRASPARYLRTFSQGLTKTASSSTAGPPTTAWRAGAAAGV
jgi:alpha-L-rhamnosidase